MLTLDLNTEIEQELKALADGQGKPVKQLLKDLVLEYLENAHDAAQNRLAKGESKTVSFEEVKSSHNLTDAEKAANANHVNQLKAFFATYQKDITGFKFDREEANAR